MKKLKRETPDERVVRKSLSNGDMVIEPTVGCSLKQFLEELKSAGYEMVDAFYKERINAKNPRKPYHMVRFVFARHEFATISDEFKEVRKTILAELKVICENALWRVRAFRNPFYKNGEEIQGEFAISINMEARQPLFLPNGQPVVIWKKDESGERVGEAPLPISPIYHLRVVNRVVSLKKT